MAQHRPAVPLAVRRQLLAEAGGKCSNPGCANRLVDLHHIKAWAVYGTHNPDEMIAICPNCHAAIHRGALRITDEELRVWKGLPSASEEPPGHLYVAPADQPMLLLGSVAARSRRDLTVLRVGGRDLLRFKMVEDRILHVSVTSSDRNGTELVRIVDGHVLTENGANVTMRPGRVLLGRSWTEIMPSWALARFWSTDPSLGAPDTPLLDVRVEAPGLVRIRGGWCVDDSAVVVTDNLLAFANRHRTGALRFGGNGLPNSVIEFAGDLDVAVLFEV